MRNRSCPQVRPNSSIILGGRTTRATLRMLGEAGRLKAGTPLPAPQPIFPRYVEPEEGDRLTMLVDSHCHLDFPDFAAERDAIVARARVEGIGRMVTISTRVEKFAEIEKIADTYDDVFCSVGTHPHHADKEPDVTTADLVKLASGPRSLPSARPGSITSATTVRVEGQERGLPPPHRGGARDGPAARDPCPRRRRRRRPHSRRRVGKGRVSLRPALLYRRRQIWPQRGVALGGYVSFSGVITFKKSEALREIAANLPADRILVETDAPFLAPEPFRGKRNEPALVTHTARSLAEARKTDFETIKRQTTAEFLPALLQGSGAA